MPRLAKPLPDAVTLAEVAERWERSMRSDNKSERTITTYVYAMRWLIEHVGGDRPIDRITRDDHEALLDALRVRGWKPASLSTVYRPLRAFWKFVVEHDALPVSKDPMHG